MSKDLDDKLAIIPISRKGFDYLLTDGEIAQIKQVFADERYRQINVSRATHGRDSFGNKLPKGEVGQLHGIKINSINGDENIMTGQEWYDRFEKKLSSSTMIQRGLVLAVAKKASGL